MGVKSKPQAASAACRVARGKGCPKPGPPGLEGFGLIPGSHAGLVEAPPGEEGTRIHLPRRRDVRVPQHPLRGDIGMARQNLLGQGNDLDKLRLGKGR